jgi:hypothetical protein
MERGTGRRPRGRRLPDVRFAPKAAEVLRCRELSRCANRDRMQRSKIYCLFDHLVGAREQRRRYFEA